MRQSYVAYLEDSRISLECSTLRHCFVLGLRERNGEGRRIIFPLHKTLRADHPRGITVGPARPAV